MIVSCPSCATRYNLPAMAAGPLRMTCRACGHAWKEIDAVDVIDITDVDVQPVRSIPHLARTGRDLAVIDHDESPDAEAARLSQIARDAQAEHQQRQFRRRRKMQQWAVFSTFVLAPFVGAALLPETVVAAAPISIKAYEALGYNVNIYGLEVRRVEREHILANGQRILSIKGEISNTESSIRKLPWLRFALLGPAGEELYAWTLDTGARPLRAGETTSFVTRVSAPPEAAQNLQIRFARADEIGVKQANDQP